MYEWNASVIFSCFGQPLRKVLYPLMCERATFYEVLTGYINNELAHELQKKVLPLEDRKMHVIYRASQLPYWFGSHGQIKHRIAGIAAERASRLGLTCDISTRQSDTIVGEAWLKFMASGKVVIGCESGSSVLDRRGEIQAKISRMLQSDPTMTFDQVSEQMSPGWDNYSFFALSPRHLEGIITKTCQVLVEGSYNGILEPDLHYIPLRRDFSNLDEALERTKDTRSIQEMVERAYRDIFLSGRCSQKILAYQIQNAISRM
jgi:hypothetical protein